MDRSEMTATSELSRSRQPAAGSNINPVRYSVRGAGVYERNARHAVHCCTLYLALFPCAQGGRHTQNLSFHLAQ